MNNKDKPAMPESEVTMSPNEAVAALALLSSFVRVHTMQEGAPVELGLLHAPSGQVVRVTTVTPQVGRVIHRDGEPFEALCVENIATTGDSDGRRRVLLINGQMEKYVLAMQSAERVASASR